MFTVKLLPTPMFTPQTNQATSSLNKAENSNSLGMVLIEAFSKQVDGNYTFRIDDGTEFSLTFDCSLDL